VSLRDYQQQAVNSLFAYFRCNKSGNPVLVLPTGTGKTHVIAGFCKEALQQWPHTRIMIATHVKELVEQNFKKLKLAWPSAPVGVYSAGLQRRDTSAQIIVGGIASVANAVPKFGRRDLLIIDECHLLSPNQTSRYQTVIEQLRLANPRLRVVGLSATPYRLGQGHLCDDGLFTDVCCHQADVRWFDFFIERGYLAPVQPWKPPVQANLDGVGKRGGDYALNQLQAAVDVDDLTRAAVANMVEKGQDRKSWLVFASGVQHAIHVAEALSDLGIPAAPIYGELKKHERDKLIDNFRSGRLRCLVNNNVLTTGFDHPPIDLIGMLRPTTSPSLWVQMVGRGMRPAPGKSNCLVLDYAGNTARLGPVNDPVLPRKRGAKGDGAPPVKICPECDCYNHTTARECYFCGYEFPKNPRLSTEASQDDLLATDHTVTHDIEIERITYVRHSKKGKPPSLRVTYYRGLESFDEWVCFEHEGYARRMAEAWWALRSTTPCPSTVDEAISRWDELAQPAKVRVWRGSKYPRVVDYLF
jgi:DNA repair protein RadD